MDSIVELASMFKERDNKPYMGPQVGVVISPPPGLKVRLGDTIILDKDHLIIAAQVMPQYEREVNFSGRGKVTLVKPPPPEPVVTSDTWGMESTSLEGSLKFTDTLQEGEEVILIPSTDIQTYFLIDKAVRLK